MKISVDDIKAANQQLNDDKYPWVDEALLESALSSYSYYESPLEQACSIFRGLVKNHAFSNANKRTACVVLIDLLRQAGLEEPSSEDLIGLVLDVAEHQYEVEEIASRLRELIHN